MCMRWLLYAISMIALFCLQTSASMAQDPQTPEEARKEREERAARDAREKMEKELRLSEAVSDTTDETVGTTADGAVALFIGLPMFTIAGALTGGLIALEIEDCGESGDELCGLSFLSGAAIGGLCGLVLGAVILSRFDGPLGSDGAHAVGEHRGEFGGASNREAFGTDRLRASVFPYRAYVGTWRASDSRFAVGFVVKGSF